MLKRWKIDDSLMGQYGKGVEETINLGDRFTVSPLSPTMSGILSPIPASITFPLLATSGAPAMVPGASSLGTSLDSKREIDTKLGDEQQNVKQPLAAPPPPGAAPPNTILRPTMLVQYQHTSSRPVPTPPKAEIYEKRYVVEVEGMSEFEADKLMMEMIAVGVTREYVKRIKYSTKSTYSIQVKSPEIDDFINATKVIESNSMKPKFTV